jgi:non-ribosomal peptide synthase protein (TIGR01720 family)
MQGQPHPAVPDPSKSLPSSGLLSKEGVEAFGRILNNNPASPQIAVSTQDLSWAIKQANEFTQSQLLEHAAGLAQPALKSLHHRPDVQTEYVAPSSDLEQKMAEIWQELLGFDQIGLHDNFFELGGDSVLAIQVIARANKLGLQITPQQIFQNQTIAALAALLRQGTIPESAQDSVTGMVPLTPFQQALFENNGSAAGPHSRALLLESRQLLNGPLLKKAVESLFTHHDALRIRFEQAQGGWQQIDGGFGIDAPFLRVDLSNISDVEKGRGIERVAASLQEGLDLLEAPLLRIALLDLGPLQPGYLLLAAHDLIIDSRSWQILISHLGIVYEQLSRGEVIELPLKTASFKHCAEQLIEHARSELRDDEASYWLDERPLKAARLPVDYLDNSQQQTRHTLSLTLSVEETQALLEDATAAYHVRVGEVLLTALVESLSEWTGSRSLLVDLTADWRQGYLVDVDASQTIGNFNFRFPVSLNLETGLDLGQALKAVKEHLRSMPDQGLSYGLMRYSKADSDMAAKLRAFPAPQISFSYTGEMVKDSTDGLFNTSQKLPNSPHQPLTSGAYLFSIDSLIVEDRLQINWTYGENVYRRSTVEHLLNRYEDSLQSLISHCQSVEAAHYTASDFPLANLDERKLNKLAMLINSIDEA